MVRKGDEVITKSPLWHRGEDIGDRLGRVLDTTSYVMVEIYDYHSNPVKCFRNDVEAVNKANADGWEEMPEEGLFDEDDLDNLPLDLFNLMTP